MRLLALLSAVAMLVLLTGCDGTFAPSEPMATGAITGVLSVDPDVHGTAANAVVSLYCSCNAMRTQQPARTVLTDDRGNFSFADVCCGTYYIDAWKDNDGSGTITSGDFAIEHITPELCACEVYPGGTTMYCRVLQVVP